MNSKTLLVFSCILAAAQARPTAVASPTSCSVSCSGRNFWTGYKVGTTLQYTFEQKVELKSGLSQQKSVLMQVTGQANVEVHSDCEMVLTVDIQGTKSSKAPSEADNLEDKTLPKALVDALKAPLRFAFEDGRIGGMCPGSSEIRASLNFKRGLLSQLHVSLDVPDQKVASNEEDVLGNCWTVYTPLGGNKMEKTKDLSSCTNNFEVFPRQGVKYEAPASNRQWPTVVQGNLKCTIELESESKVIKKNLCIEERMLENNMGKKSKGESVRVETSLRLKGKMDTLASTLFEIGDRSDLKHRHKTGDKCHDSKVWFEEDIFHSGNECLEKKLPTSGTTSSDFKTLAKQTLEQLCEETRAREMLNSTAKKYSEAIKYMRGITSQEDFNSLFNWVKNEYCGDNEMFKVLFYSAIPSVGTRFSVKVILGQLKDSIEMSTDSKTSNWLANGIAMMPHPTPEVITDVLNFAKKIKEDSMMMVAKAPPLALSAVTGRYCTINTDCENNDAIAAVLEFFSTSLGTNCSNLVSNEDPVAYDYAFVSLLSTGNIGRAAGGAPSILGCAENTRLSLANRAFALRSLRRFPSLKKAELMRLGKLIKSSELDSELRITAYQVMARYADTSLWSDERVINQLSSLMQNKSEDQHVQRYIYSHLRQWMQKQTRLTDSYSLSTILRQYERTMIDKQLGGLLVSSYMQTQFKDQSFKSKVDMESNLIYSSSSMMPRFVNLNFTVESPLSGESINMFELGVRMEGLEGMAEQFFNMFSPTGPPSRKRRQASMELTDEQKQYQQQSGKQRLDMFTRYNGMELRHENFDETILSFFPSFLKTLDADNVRGLISEKLSNFNFEKEGQSAGTSSESTISMPTISGFPILLKKEMYYLTNMIFKHQFSMPSINNVNMGLEVQPTASVYMARTVTVDSGFERAGVRSQSSGLTNMGVKLNLLSDFRDINNIQFSYKVEPLKKRQKLLELKTDVQFIQHRGPKNVIESPVVSLLAPVTSKCFTAATVKLLGRRMCMETNFERTSDPLGYVRQNPGIFRLYIDKDDSLGFYEATLRIKKEGKNFNFTAVLGDQGSPERHAKFQFVLNRSKGLRKIVVELANPVLPMKWESESKANGKKSDISVAMKFGSTDYVFSGTRAKDKDGIMKMEGDFYRKDMERKKLNIVTKFKSFGLLMFIPMYQLDLSVTTSDNDQITFEHLSRYTSGNLQLSLLASHAKAGSVVTSIKSQVECSRSDGKSGRRIFQYDTEVMNKNGMNFQHTFTATTNRRPKAASDTFDSTMSIIHKFNYGPSKQQSALDVEANLNMEETIRPGQLYKSTGSGSITYGPATERKTVTLTKLRFVLGEDDVIDDHFETKTFLMEYGAEMDGSQSGAMVAMQALPIRKWRPYNQCIYFKLNTTKTTSQESQASAFELRHTTAADKRFSPYIGPKIMQAFKVVYSNQVLVDTAHKFNTIDKSGDGFVYGHSLNATIFNGQSYSIRNRYTWDTVTTPTFRVNTIASVDQQNTVQVNQSIIIDKSARRADYQLNYKVSTSEGSMRIYSQDQSLDDRRKSAMEVVNYLRGPRRLPFNFVSLLEKVAKFIYQIKFESGLVMNIPSYKLQVTNYVDMTVTKGIMLNFSRILTTDETSFIKSVWLSKELERSNKKFCRRAYQLNWKDNNINKLFTSEIVYKRNNKNPQLSISVSQASLIGSKSNDFNFTTVGQFTPQYQREGQVALQLNVTHLVNDVTTCKANVKMILDTKLKTALNPAINVSFEGTTTEGTLNGEYSIVVKKSELGGSIKKIKSLTNEIKLTNTIPRIPFRAYSGTTALSLTREQPFSFVLKRTLDDADIINIETTLNSNKLYIGMKSDRLPAREVSYTAQYSKGTDGFIKYLSQVRFNVLQLNINIKDNGSFKASGRSGEMLFFTVYSGSMEISGLDQLIGREIPMDRLDYGGRLEARTTGEFDSNHQVFKVKGTTSENAGLVSTKFNIWPFEISAQVKTPLWDIDQYGFNISAGPNVPESGYRFKAWVASPAQQSSLTYWHTSPNTDTFEANGQATLMSDHLFSEASDQIKSTFRITGSSLYDSTFFMNVTTPYNVLQMMECNFMLSNPKQAASFKMKMDNTEVKVMDYERSIRTNTDGTTFINGSFSVTSPKPEATGWKKASLTGDAVFGNDYLWGMVAKKDNTKVASVDLVYVKSGTTYPQQGRLAVPGANVGYDIQIFSSGFLTLQRLQSYLLRSGNDASAEWKMGYKGGLGEMETTVAVTNGRVASGSGVIFGKSVTFSSPSDGVLEISVASTDGKNKITWTADRQGNLLQNLNMKFSFGEKESCVVYGKQGQQIDIQYGSCKLPNTIKINYQFANLWMLSQATANLTVKHTVQSNSVFHVLPEFSFTIPSTLPFTFVMDINNELYKGNVSFKNPYVTFLHEHDFSNFPTAMRFKQEMKYSMGSELDSQKFIINYDTTAKTIDIQAEIENTFKFVASKTAINLEINKIFTAGVEYMEEESTGKQMIEMKGDWRQATGTQPCVLRLWKMNIDGGNRLALEFVQNTGKDISIVSDVTNFKITDEEIAMDISTTLSSTLIEKLRSANSVISLSMLKSTEKYTLNYKESFTAGSVMYYKLESVFKGKSGQFPSTMNITFPKGMLQSEFSYNFNPEYNSESYIRWSLDKIGDYRNSYLLDYRTKDVSAHVGKMWRDFNLEISSPSRQVYLSENCKQLENGTIQTEIQAFINKRNGEGFAAIFTKDFTMENVYKRGLQLTLPTRKVGYERVLRIDGKKLAYNVTIFWDMHTDMEKKIVVQFNREKESRESGYYYYHRVDMMAPFLKNMVSKELLYEQKDQEFELTLTHTQESDDKVTIKMNGLKYYDQASLSMKKELNISFEQQKGNVKANAKVIVDSTKLSKSRIYTRSKYLMEINIYATVPSKSIDSHVRIRSVPSEEFTFACNHGATFSYRYFKGFEKSRLSLFVSNSERNAGQLTIKRDWVKSTWEATLDSGSGYMDPKSSLSFPLYKPTKVFVKATAGISKNRKKIHFGIVNGPMNVDASIKLWKPDTVPADLDFFFVGAKLSKDNTLSYASHWRIRRMTKKSPFIIAKEVLVDPWAKAENLPLSIGTINSLMQPVKQSNADNINTDVVLDMLTSISSNDIDSLKRWAAKARENNEFMSNTIGKAIVAAFNVFKSGVQTWATMVRSSPYTESLPQLDLGVRATISMLSDYAAYALNRVPIESFWSTTLAMTKYCSDQFSAYFSAYTEMLDNMIRQRISRLTGGSGTSILSLIYSAISSVYPVTRAFEKFGIISQQYSECLNAATVELSTQFAGAVQPILMSTLGEVPRVYDFFENIVYERSRWCPYFPTLVQAVTRGGTGSIEQEFASKSAYSRNLAASMTLLLDGYYGRAIRQFFNTEVNEVRVWRLSCDQACLGSGSFAAINGTLFLPFPMTSFPKAPRKPGMFRPTSGLKGIAQRFNMKLMRATKKLQGRQGIMGMLYRLIVPTHRTAEVKEDSIITFGGASLRNLSPCRYLLAHDFLAGDFSIFQTYTWTGRARKRGDLLIRFGSLQATITSDLKLKLGDEQVSLPVERKYENLVVNARSYTYNTRIKVQFHTDLRNVIVVRCTDESCSVRIHPLYHGRVNGAFGSNDGNAANDLHAASASDHMRLWTAGSCVMAVPTNK